MPGTPAHHPAAVPAVADLMPPAASPSLLPGTISYDAPPAVDSVAEDIAAAVQESVKGSVSAPTPVTAVDPDDAVDHMDDSAPEPPTQPEPVAAPAPAPAAPTTWASLASKAPGQGQAAR